MNQFLQRLVAPVIDVMARYRNADARPATLSHLAHLEKLAAADVPKLAEVMIEDGGRLLPAFVMHRASRSGGRAALTLASPHRPRNRPDVIRVDAAGRSRHWLHTPIANAERDARTLPLPAAQGNKPIYMWTEIAGKVWCDPDSRTMLSFSAEELAYLHGDANRGYVREFTERFRRDPAGFNGLQARRKGSFMRLPIGNEWVSVMYLGTQAPATDGEASALPPGAAFFMPEPSRSAAEFQSSLPNMTFASDTPELLRSEGFIVLDRLSEKTVDPTFALFPTRSGQARGGFAFWVRAELLDALPAVSSAWNGFSLQPHNQIHRLLKIAAPIARLRGMAYAHAQAQAVA